MLSVIGSVRMGSIKKHIFLLLVLFFSCPHLDAMCPQTVGPISINDGTWSLLSRVGQATNAIQSQICGLSFSATTSSQSSCIQFGQSDIGAGGVYTINSPGVYCMYNDASWSAGAAITVNSSDVTIDMQSHTLNGGSSGVTGIIINTGLNNVTIKNGNITNPTSACIANSAVDAPVQNIIIQNMNFSVLNVAASYPAVSIQGGAFYNVLIENCTGYNTYIILNPGLSAIVRGCRFTCNGLGASSSGNASITIQGLSSGPPTFGQSALIEDCSLANDNPTTYPTNNASFTVSWMETAVIRNCVSSGSGDDGFTVSDGVNAALYNCVAQQSAGNGFLFQPGSTTAMNISATSCFAQGCIHGFWVKNFAGDSGCKSVVFINCVAQNSAQNGFYVTNTETAVDILIPITFRYCDSNGNGGNGFEIGISSGGYSPVGYGQVFHCVASNNSVEGFAVANNVTGLTIEHCWAVNNGGIGFYDANSSSPPNFYWGTRSFNNTGGAYSSIIYTQSSYTYDIARYGSNIYYP